MGLSEIIAKGIDYAVGHLPWYVVSTIAAILAFIRYGHLFASKWIEVYKDYSSLNKSDRQQYIAYLKTENEELKKENKELRDRLMQ